MRENAALESNGHQPIEQTVPLLLHHRDGLDLITAWIAAMPRQ
jgi:hypothetical protein